MKVENDRPVAGTARATGATKTGASDRPAATPATGASPIADAVTIMGIPESELSPKVSAALQALMEEVAQLREKLEQSRKRITYLEQLADQDSLVPVINRRAFVRELSRMMSFSERYGTPSSVLYYDVNHMKKINDGFGHAAGDAALGHIVDVLLANIRESDVLGRLGGDEFGVLLAQADETQANEKAALLAAAIVESAFEWNGQEIPMSVSYGTHTFNGGEEADDVLCAADRAMYVHKKEKASSQT